MPTRILTTEKNQQKRQNYSTVVWSEPAFELVLKALIRQLLVNCPSGNTRFLETFSCSKF
jgi:hypothetical protein